MILTPELYSAAYDAYRRSDEITEGKTNLNEFIPSNAKNGDHYFSILIYLLLDNEKPELFMEKRGVIVKNESESESGLEWKNRPNDELPFRITIRADYMAYAWDEYGMGWSLDFGFPNNPIAEELDKDFLAWLRVFEDTDLDNHGRPIINFSWQEFHQSGLALAKRLKMLGQNNIVVFYEKPYEDVFIVETIQLVKIDESALRATPETRL